MDKFLKVNVLWAIFDRNGGNTPLTKYVDRAISETQMTDADQTIDMEPAEVDLDHKETTKTQGESEVGYHSPNQRDREH